MTGVSEGHSSVLVSQLSCSINLYAAKDPCELREREGHRKGSDCGIVNRLEDGIWTRA